MLAGAKPLPELVQAAIVLVVRVKVSSFSRLSQRLQIIWIASSVLIDAGMRTAPRARRPGEHCAAASVDQRHHDFDGALGEVPRIVAGKDEIGELVDESHSAFHGPPSVRNSMVAAFTCGSQ
jgi:hypothetical protein